MKQIFNKYTILVSTLLLFASCDSVFEGVEPATSVSGEVVLSSPDGVNALRASLYYKLINSFDYSTEYFVGPSAFADETRARVGASRYVAENLANDASGTVHLVSYSATYSIIQDANLLIHAIEDGVLDDAVRDRYRGEAYALRAYAMHHLVRALGYEPGNYDQGELEANWDLGIVLRLEPTIDVADADERPRATVDDVYTQILDDLAEAKTLLSGINSDKTKVTEAFVDALTARVNLYAGKWGAASTAAQAAITNSGLSLQDTPDGIAGMFDETDGDHPEAILKLVVHPNTEPIGGSNVNNGMAAYTASQWVAQVPTQMVLDLYSPDDYRLGDFVTDAITGDTLIDPRNEDLLLYEGGWYMPCNDNQQNYSPVGGCDAVNNDGLSSRKWVGEKGNLADNIPVMRISEMYLIWAEAAAKSANDPNAGVAPLQTLKDARNAGPIPAGATASITAFEDEILDERVRELVLEGHRFWDLKRLGRDIRHPDGSIKMRAEAYRILAPIGSGLRNVNSLLDENPGYN